MNKELEIWEEFIYAICHASERMYCPTGNKYKYLCTPEVNQIIQDRLKVVINKYNINKIDNIIEYEFAGNVISFEESDKNELVVINKRGING